MGVRGVDYEIVAFEIPAKNHSALLFLRLERNVEHEGIVYASESKDWKFTDLVVRLDFSVRSISPSSKSVSSSRVWIIFVYLLRGFEIKIHEWILGGVSFSAWDILFEYTNLETVCTFFCFFFSVLYRVSHHRTIWISRSSSKDRNEKIVRETFRTTSFQLSFDRWRGFCVFSRRFFHIYLRVSIEETARSTGWKMTKSKVTVTPRASYLQQRIYFQNHREGIAVGINHGVKTSNGRSALNHPIVTKRLHCASGININDADILSCRTRTVSL